MVSWCCFMALFMASFMAFHLHSTVVYAFNAECVSVDTNADVGDDVGAATNISRMDLPDSFSLREEKSGRKGALTSKHVRTKK